MTEELEKAIRTAIHKKATESFHEIWQEVVNELSEPMALHYSGLTQDKLEDMYSRISSDVAKAILNPTTDEGEPDN